MSRVKRDSLELELLRVVLRMDDTTQRRFLLYVCGMLSDYQTEKLALVAAKEMLTRRGRGK